MRRSQRLIAATVLAAMSVALAGCSSGSFDPTDMMDWFDTKKKLPGERRPVFPEGVPGVEQGVPRDMYKGTRQDLAPAPAAEAPAPAPEQRKPAGRSAAREAEPFPTPVDDASAPAPKMKKPKRTRITAPEPDAEPAPAPQRQQQQAAPQQQPPSFPAPLPSGGFAR
ncbi:hypothetical protein [Afipia birgiae]|jgi:hypothetical protein|uniref:hypothetical protein n=1 Tax=Afipia birgiae TaxID=151414 RepID=UPI0002E1A5AA|nr:hypothetical protein [Afipia birgiae]MBX9821852.1 hypothetical protein [Afipia birgiae]